MEEEERGSRQFLIPRTRPDTPSKPPATSPAFRFSFPCFFPWVDHSNLVGALFSWSIFFLLAVGVPMMSHFLLICNDCDFGHQRPYDGVVQLSLSVFAGISFVFLSFWSRKYGIRRFLFLDKLWDVSDKVKSDYEAEIQKSLKLLMIFVLPLLTLESIYRIWWYATGFSGIPYLFNPLLSHSIACALQLFSWLYRTSLFIFVCILYQLTCHLQFLRLDDFAHRFASEISDVASVLKEHFKIRRNLRIVSHRFRRFILLSLVLITASQFMALLMTMRASIPTNIYEAGELALCSISLVTGLFICLRSATKITHKGQSVTSLAAKWNVCATVDSFDGLDGETPGASINQSQILPIRNNIVESEEDEDEGDGDDDPANAKIMPIYARTISFQKRQALVTYLENNRAGITVYGFTVDRSWLHTIFGIELALLLWLLNKTIGVQEYVTCREGDVRRLPFGDNYFDVVVSAVFLHTVGKEYGHRTVEAAAERIRVLGEMVRVLKPGGVGVVWDLVHVPEYVRRLQELKMEDIRVSERVTAFMVKSHMVSFRKPSQHLAGPGEVRLDWRC